MIFYCLLSKQICLCIAIGFTAFSCHNVISRKNVLIFYKPEDHWSCIAHLSAEDMLKWVVIEEKKF